MVSQYRTKKYCYKPFEDIEIHPDGSVYTCCPYWKNIPIGNVFTDSVENIWNSENAVELRKRILNNDYSLCNKERCLKLTQEGFKTQFDTAFEPVMKEFPKRINLGYDTECNSACIICRDGVYVHSDDKLAELNSKIDSVYIPLLKNAKIVTINSAGDPFSSRHSRLLIKRIIEKIPDIKFEFLTNGLMASEKVFNDLNITTDRIEAVNISIHAATKETYGKMINDGEIKFDTLMNNIKYISSLNKNNDFKLYFNFVVTSLNYQDLPAFIKLVIKYKAYPVIWEYRPEQNNGKNKRREELTITEKTHPKYKDLVKVLKNPLLIASRHYIAPILQHIQDEKVNDNTKWFNLFDYINALFIK